MLGAQQGCKALHALWLLPSCSPGLSRLHVLTLLAALCQDEPAPKRQAVAPPFSTFNPQQYQQLMLMQLQRVGAPAGCNCLPCHALATACM